ncbi:MAG: O-antigen ligase family protein [Phycisphaerales bacterium]
MGGLLNLDIWQLAVLGVGGVAALGLCAVNFRFSIMLVGLMLFFTSISTQTTWNLLLVRTIITNLQAQRSTMYLASGGLLLLCALMHSQRLKLKSINGFAVILAFSGLYAGMIRLFAADFGEGAQSVVFALATLIPLVLVPPALIRDWWDMYILPRVVAVVGAGWCGLCVLQFLANRRALTTGYLTQRFVGMTGNPQHASAFLAFVITCCVFLLLNDPKKRYRFVWMGTAALCSVFIIWTASRTGVAMTAIGVFACFYGRAGVGAMLLPVAGLVAFGAFKFLAGQRVDFDVERFTMGGQTRAGVWEELWQKFVDNPVYGTGGTGAQGGFRSEKSENSLLYGLAAYGGGMGLIIIAMFMASMKQVYDVIRARRGAQPYQKRVTEFALGTIAMFWAGSVFEGYIVGRVSAPIVYMMLFSAIAARAVDMIRQERAAEWEIENDPNAAAAGGDGYGEYGEGSTADSEQNPYGDGSPTATEPRAA